MSVSKSDDPRDADVPQHDHEAALAEARRQAETLSAQLRAERQAREQEREQRTPLVRERDSLRTELATVRRRVDEETQAHAKTRGNLDALQAKLSAAGSDGEEARREAARQREAAERVSRELQELRRELANEKEGHLQVRERLATLEAGRERGAQELGVVQGQAQRLEAEAAVLRQRLMAEQSTLLEVQQKFEALAKEADLAGERAAAAKRALAEETAAHAETRQRLEDAREAVRRAERKRQRQTVASVLGGVAIGLAAVLRRRG